MSIGVDDPTRRFERCEGCGGLVDPVEAVCRNCGKELPEEKRAAPVAAVDADGDDLERTQVMPVVERAPAGGSVEYVSTGASPYTTPPTYAVPPRRAGLPLVPLLVVLLGLGAAAAVFALGSRVDWAWLGQLSAPAPAPEVGLGTPRPDPGGPAPVKPAKPGLAGVQPAPTQPGAAGQPAAPAPTVKPGGTLVVANTSGDGVYIRRTPRLNDRIVAWPDGTRMQDLGEQVTGDGQTWRKVKDPRGNEGYVPVQWLAVAPG